MRIYVETIDNFAVYRRSWQLTGAVASSVAGTVIDAEARMAIDSILAGLAAQGILMHGP